MPVHIFKFMPDDKIHRRIFAAYSTHKVIDTVGMPLGGGNQRENKRVALSQQQIDQHSRI